MRASRGFLCLAGMAAIAFAWTTPAMADTGLPGAQMSLWWGLPFVGLLLSIATGPVLFPTMWEKHFGKISALWGALVIVPLAFWVGPSLTLTVSLDTLLLEYMPFIILLLALFTIAGGIFIEGDIKGTPLNNTVQLIIGTVLASFVGTTGAAMIMIRPLIRANAKRKHNVHVIVFFIFLVCNTGGSLTPLGDPPLFVGFLRGVHFFWTTKHIIVETATLSSILLVLFFIMDMILYKGEDDQHDRPQDSKHKIRLRGAINIPLLFGVIFAILLSAWWDSGTGVSIHGVTLELQDLTRDGLMLLMAILSLFLSHKEHRIANDFAWGPIIEVGKLFAAIFVCLVPVAAMLQAGLNGPLAPLVNLVTGPDGNPDNLRYFWLTGLLSSVLDNTPTYLVFFDLAGGDAQHLMSAGAATLAAISSGAVFMGANTYIGNAPNFMVYAIARDQGVRMPHFFAYMLWSLIILIPLFILASWLFFT